MRGRPFVQAILIAMAMLSMTANAEAAAEAAHAAGAASNPLLAPWSGPYGGTPPFDKVRVADFKPALEAAMAENLAEIDTIAKNPAAPNFENTIAALERAGQTFNRVNALYNVWSSTMNTGKFQAVEREMGPKLAAFADSITQNTALFARIDAVYNSPQQAQLSPVQQRLCWVYRTNFVLAGAQLGPESKARVAAINERLAALFANFSQNLLAEEADYVLYLKQESDLAGLPEPLRAAASSAAAAQGHPGEWAILNTRSSMEPFLTYSERRDLREKVWRTYYSRGDNGNAHDNKKIITEILALRAERAKLLGYASHAHWRVADSMAKTPENAMHLMMQVWPAAVARVHEEVADMQGIADSEHAGIKIAAWDYRYYAEKVRKAKYDLDMNEVKPYLQLEKLREGMFWAAGQLYGFTFVPVSGLPVAQPNIRVWEVKNAEGKHVGLWYFDPYLRTGKNSGAWMSEYRGQESFDRHISPIVSNNTNFVKSAGGKPILISWDDAVTLFHEFGHALHGLNSDVPYPTLAGTNVVRDFVEFPSQLNENWLPTPEVLSRFAVHYRTGAPIPPQLVEKIKKTSTFNQGFATVEYLASALVDMKLHLANDPKIDPDKFEAETLASIGMPDEVVMRHRTPQFAHIFSSDAYSAGYYSYLWAEVLDRDAFDAFTQAGGPYDKAVAKRLHDDIMAVGNSVDPGQAYRNFRGADPKIDALLRARGFAPSSKGGME
ncbi:MAG TPA: M3 family metallopeptidase [Steroidobacteraceae bacterium]|nr:M3 family metallopeptidase [Steroidobacteraceae bacterium]